ncbi:MAG: 3-phosphoshikimate 1-carboxyvinyltransferase [Abditibacteriota bacterium]|nr:3-phosphoshikimate 1-carboxyvinyltransferase [Abditibacteriota bacterium]
MILKVRPSHIGGFVTVPGSKSHTIRAVAIAALADGVSEIRNPLVSEDTLSAVEAYRSLGAEIECLEGLWRVKGFERRFGNTARCKVVNETIDVGDSGTTLYIAMGIAALGFEESTFIGNERIMRRPVKPLADVLNQLGALVTCSEKGTPPVRIVPCRCPKDRDKRAGCFTPKGIREVTLDCSKTSQYLTALLLNYPTACCGTVIHAKDLVERPYIDMTLNWVRSLGIVIDEEPGNVFKIRGGQEYKPFTRDVPSDFSTATFFLCGSALASMTYGTPITVKGLDMNDTQGDKGVIDILRQMGASAEINEEGVTITASRLRGITVDLGDMPDSLPMLAVTACFAEGVTRFTGVAQARLKETDRIAVMRQELTKAGCDIEETEDGLIIRKSDFKGGCLSGHGDHRVAMSLAVGGCFAQGETVIEDADAVSVTFPGFAEAMVSLGADLVKQ